MTGFKVWIVRLVVVSVLAVGASMAGSAFRATSVSAAEEEARCENDACKKFLLFGYCDDGHTGKGCDKKGLTCESYDC